MFFLDLSSSQRTGSSFSIFLFFDFDSSLGALNIISFLLRAILDERP
jgi:hypothetical protein